MRKKITLSALAIVLLCAGFVAASAASTVNFEVTQVTVNETDGLPEEVSYLIRRTGDLNETARVAVSTIDGTATAGQIDFGPFQRTVTFAPGESQLELRATAINDYIYEGTEWFWIRLSSASPNVRIGSQHTLTVLIRDTDDYPKVRFEAPTPNDVFMKVEPTAGRQVVASVRMRLTKPSFEPVSVTFNTTDGTATAGTDYLPTTSTVTFQPFEFEKQVTVTILGDGMNESRETFDMNLFNAVNADILISPLPFTIINKTPYPQHIDFDGNGLADFAYYAQFTGRWFIGQYGETNFHLNFPGDVLVPGDYTGDGQTDAAIWRPENGTWYVLRSEDSSYYAVHFGATGDVPIPADFDADGMADLAVFRPSTGIWFIQRSSDGATDVVQFGIDGDRPTPADFDGDWKADLAIYRPGSTESSQWWIKRSSDGVVTVTSFGLAADRTVAADYTGDGKTDIAVWRPSNGQWFVLRSEDSSYYLGPYGVSGGTQPAPGDYNGDGLADFGRLDSWSRSFGAVTGTAWPWISAGGAGNLDPTVTTPLAIANVH